MLKDVSYFLKKLIFSEFKILKKRILRSIKKPLEPELLIISKLSDKQKISIDVGVFRGVYSYILSNHSKKVIGFEANPIMFNYLKKNLKKIVKNFELFNIALSNRDGKCDLKVPLRNKSFFKSNFEDYYEGGMATIEKLNMFGGKKFDTFEVKTQRLDNFNFQSEIGFVKIDVEGHEQSVLEGSINTLKKYKPNLLIEIDRRYNVDVNKTFKFLNDLGYNFYFYNKEKLIKITSYEENYQKNFRNFIFLSK